MAWATSPMPLTVSRKYPSLSGFSGFPKLRQSVRLCGLAPTATRFLTISSTAEAPPLNGLMAVKKGVDAVVIARAL